jgi:hypothetical protein
MDTKDTKGRPIGIFLCVLSVLCVRSALALPAVSIAAAARSIQPGELVVLTIDTAVRADRLRVRAFNREMPAVQVGPLQWRALVGIDLGTGPGRYPVTIDARSGAHTAHAAHELVVLPRRFPTRTLQVDPAFVNPPASASARIARDARDLQELWKQSTPEPQWLEGFLRPVPNPANSAFGTRSIYNGQPRSQHGGADFLSPLGTPVNAPNAARVVLARDLYFLGNTVVLDHGQGLFSILAHLSMLAVRQGDVVTGGQVVGQVGATGRVTGPHLHWAVRVAGSRIDPLSLVDLLGPRH